MTIETGVTYKINLSRKKTLIERRVGIKAQGSGRRALGAWSRVQGEEHQLMAERYLVIGDSSYVLRVTGCFYKGLEEIFVPAMFRSALIHSPRWVSFWIEYQMPPLQFHIEVSYSQVL